MSDRQAHGSRWRRRQMCCRRACASTPGDWGSHNPVLALSCRRCRTATYTSSVAPRFPTCVCPLALSDPVQAVASESYPRTRPPLVAIPSCATGAPVCAAARGPVSAAADTAPPLDCPRAPLGCQALCWPPWWGHTRSNGCGACAPTSAPQGAHKEGTGAAALCPCHGFLSPPFPL